MKIKAFVQKASASTRPVIMGCHGWIHASRGWRTRVKRWDFIGGSKIAELCEKHDFALYAPQSDGWLGNWAERHAENAHELFSDMYDKLGIGPEVKTYGVGHSDGGWLMHLLHYYYPFAFDGLLVYAAPTIDRVHTPSEFSEIFLAFNNRDVKPMKKSTLKAKEQYTNAGYKVQLLQGIGDHHIDPYVLNQFFEWINGSFTSRPPTNLADDYDFMGKESI